MPSKRLRQTKCVRNIPITRKRYRSDLTDAQWNYIRRLLPKAAWRGRPRVNEREILNGIYYALRTGCQWEDLPHDIQASPKTCHRRLLEYQRRQVWSKLLKVLMQEAHRRGKLNFKNAYHDASVVKSKRGESPRSATPENTIF
jgi:transposase